MARRPATTELFITSGSVSALPLPERCLIRASRVSPCAAVSLAESSFSLANSESVISSVATMPLLCWNADNRACAFSTFSRRILAWSPNQRAYCLAGSTFNSTEASM